MFTIRDGRDHFYAWDLDRQIVVADPSIVEVHFCNRTDDCSLVVEVRDEDGLRVANVPNVLLQSSFDIRVFGYDGKATLHDKKFKVNARTRPADYMYTETVVKTIDEIFEAAEQVDTITTEFYEFVDDYKLGLVDDGEGNVKLKAVDKPASGGATESNTYFINPDAIEWQTGLTKTPAPENIIEFVQRFLAGDAVCLYTICNHESRHFVPARVSKVDDSTVAFTQAVNESWFSTSSVYIPVYRVYKSTDDCWYIRKHDSLDKSLPNKAYVDTAIQTALSGIATAEGGAY